MIALVFLILLIVIYSAAQEAPSFIYCISENCTDVNRIPCARSPPCTPTGDCKQMPMNEPLRFSITHFHNQLRSTAATNTPGASKMRALQYSKHLEILAQCWVNTCTIEKSSCLTSPFFDRFGQNLGVIDLFEKGGDLNDHANLWQEIMTVWSDELSNINADIIERIPKSENHYRYEHYIEMVTDYVAHIGCAWSSSNETMYFACFYGPHGAVSGEAVYKFGTYCSECPKDTECYKPLGLCAQTGTEVQLWKKRLRFKEVSSRSITHVAMKILYIYCLALNAGLFVQT
ncbi:hypothetical protein WA026_009646 [Henosepilachna vigintioctopunctata]|uniref:SCP domain-containing protein n=1 Tax=Henosepilachna vigintioctopunctata TaxID=420089 RepID=A0AAW1U5B5_9CUCU